MNKGLGFVPTYSTQPLELDIELQRFFRSIKLRAFFHSNEFPTPNTSTMCLPPGVDLSACKPTSRWVPPTVPPEVDTFIRLVQKDVRKINWKLSSNKAKTHNFTKADWEAIHSLKNDPSIVIKPADKGGATVIMNQIDYHKEIMRQLDDPQVYRVLPGDPLPDLKREIDTLINKAHNDGIIDTKTQQFLLTDFPATPSFYILPKVHKNLTSPPGRPIVAGTHSVFQNLAIFLDKILQTKVLTTASFLLDTGDFLTKINNLNNLPSGAILCTMDVNSLYTAIPHTEGIACIQETLDSMNLAPPMKQFLLTLLTIILTKNYFQYQESYYIQLQGTAMGSNVAPTYANLFMDKFERQHVYTHPDYSDHVLLWLRYIDDIFFIWTGDTEKLLDFKTDLDSALETISFSLDHSITQVHFLDVEVTKTGPCLSCDIYRKPTDRNTYLSFDSYHPPPLKSGLPYSQFIRLRRITSSDQQFHRRAEDMTKDFLARGYPLKILQDAKSKAESKTRSELLKFRPKSAPTRLPMILTYSTQSQLVKNIISKHWHTLSCNSDTDPVFSHKPMFIHKKSKNLRNHLIRAKQSVKSTKAQEPSANWLQSSQAPQGMYPCGHCAQCGYTSKSTKFSHPHTGKEYIIRDFITCSSSNLIYLLKCPCGLGYVGKTSRPLRQRISEHRSCIRRGDPTSPIAKHFLTSGHQIWQLRFTGIELIKQPPSGISMERFTLQRELKWIYELDTRAPRGLNEDWDLSPFL